MGSPIPVRCIVRYGMGLAVAAANGTDITGMEISVMSVLSFRQQTAGPPYALHQRLSQRLPLWGELFSPGIAVTGRPV